MNLTTFIAQANGYELAVDFGAGKFNRIRKVEAERRIAIEICADYCRYFTKPADVELVCGDMRDYLELVDLRGADAVALMIDSLEHIEKPDGLRLLRSMQENFSRILVFAPVGEDPQEVDVWGYGNEWQRHRSSWWPADLEELGFVVDVYPTYHGKVGAMFADWGGE